MSSTILNTVNTMKLKDILTLIIGMVLGGLITTFFDINALDNSILPSKSVTNNIQSNLRNSNDNDNLNLNVPMIPFPEPHWRTKNTISARTVINFLLLLFAFF